jgi:fibronectin-binding autotransporter adhesin
VLFFVGAPNDARAQAFITWQGSGTNWTTGANWSATYEYGQLQWTGGGEAISWNDYGSSQSHWRFYFSGSKAYTLGGTAVNFFDFGGANGGILSDSTATQTINLDVRFRDNGARTAFILTRDTGALTFGGSVEVTNSVTALGIGSSNSSGIVTFNGAITGNKPIVVGTNSLAGNTTGMGETRVVFAGNNTYTGETTVERGALTITHANALGNSSAGTVVKANAVLRMSGGITVASEALTLSGGGFAESGALRSMSGSNNYDGLITLSGGNTYLAAAGGATLKVSAINGGANELWIVGDGTTILGSGATNSGSTALVKSNVGTLILSASNAWSGAEFIREGTVVLNHNNALGVGGTTTLGATAGSATATLQYGSNITNSNAVTVQATGTGQRTLSYQASSGTGEQVGNVTLNNALTVDVASGGTFRISGVVSGSGNGLTKDGAGILILAGNNSYTGATTIMGGTLRLGASDRINSGSAISIASGATFDLNNFNDNVGGISGAGSVTLGTGNMTTTVAANADFSGAITGSGTFTKAGVNTLTLSGASSDYSGGISITAGALRVSNANALGNTTGGTTASTGALELIGGISVGSEALSLSADGVSGGGALRNISGDNSWAGTVTIAGTDTRINSDGGTLSLNGALNLNSNTVYIGGVGNVTIGGTIQNGGKTSSNGALWWDGTGALRINTAPTLLSGIINLRRGTVLLGVDNALGTGAITAGEQGALTIASADTTARSIGNNITMTTSDRLNLGQATGGTGNVTLGGNLVFGVTSANHFINVAASATKATINGVVSGTGKNLIKEGAGTLSLSGNNSYTGGSFIDAGTLEFTAGTSAASVIDVGTTAAATASAATLRLAPSGNYTLNQNITVQTGGDRTIEAANTTGTVTLGGNLTLGKNVDIRAASGGTLALNGNITGDFTIGKRGAGAVTLGGTAAQGTKFDLWEGELVASSASNLGNNTGDFIGNKLYFDGGGLAVTGNLTLGGANGITLGQAGGTIRVTIGNTLTLQGYINDQEALTGITLSKTGAGTLFFDKGGVNDFSGTTLVINEGTVSTYNPDLLPAAIQLGSSAAATSGTYRFDKTDGPVTANNNFAVNSGGGVITVAADTLTLSGAVSGSGAFTKNGAGSLTLTGNSGYSGAASITAGTLQLNRTGGAALGSVSSLNVGTDAVLLLSQSDQVNNSAAVTLSGGTITRATGVGEVFGNLNVTQASMINFGGGSGNVIEFSGLAGGYTPSSLAALQLFNFTQGNSLVIRNTSNWADQINSGFTFGGDGGFGSTSFDGSTFTITAIPEPSTYLAAAGLLAMFLWPARRRLIKDAKSILGLRAPARERLEAYRNA